MAARYCKEVGELYEQLRDFEEAIKCFERTAELFLGESSPTSANQCKQKVAQFSAQLKQGDIVAVTNALERYQDLDPSFLRTRENELLTELVSAYDEEDVEKFTEVLKDDDSLSPLDSWKTILLLRIKDDLKAKERDVHLT